MAHAATNEVDVVIVGAGFAGLYMLHRARGLGLRAIVLEAAEGVGGTWYWNRYPGARVDIQSLEYSYSFSDELERDWKWSERYATQPELLRYLNHVADRFDLRGDIVFGTRVKTAVFDETRVGWTVTTSDGRRLLARYCIMATGCLSVPKEIDIPGVDAFAGASYKTSSWPQEGVDFSGLSVGVIGTGSSAIQSIPEIARQAASVTVFQRTPNFSVPAHNGPIPPQELADWQANRAAYRARGRAEGLGFMIYPSDRLAVETLPDERRQVFEERWRMGGFNLLGAFCDLGTDRAANDTAAAFVAGKIRSIVRDPAVADRLVPRDYPIGTKRLCVDTDYYETFNRPNVRLVDLRETPIETVTAAGIRTSAEEIGLDAIVYATGFDAMTGALARIDIRGRGGTRLSDRWRDGPRTCLGLMAAGFPNLFMVTGPGSPSVISNMVVSIEDHVDWIGDCMAFLEARGAVSIEPTCEAEDAWVAHVNEVADATLYPLANSWYVGANVPGKPRIFMPYVGGVPVYRQHCADVAARGYEGFRFDDGLTAVAARAT
jgi:cyclohexanone monooxygenase